MEKIVQHITLQPVLIVGDIDMNMDKRDIVIEFFLSSTSILLLCELHPSYLAASEVFLFVDKLPFLYQQLKSHSYLWISVMGFYLILYPKKSEIDLDPNLTKLNSKLKNKQS